MRTLQESTVDSDDEQFWVNWIGRGSKVRRTTWFVLCKGVDHVALSWTNRQQLTDGSLSLSLHALLTFKGDIIQTVRNIKESILGVWRSSALRALDLIHAMKLNFNFQWGTATGYKYGTVVGGKSREQNFVVLPVLLSWIPVLFRFTEQSFRALLTQKTQSVTVGVWNDSALTQLLGFKTKPASSIRVLSS